MKRTASDTVAVTIAVPLCVDFHTESLSTDPALQKRDVAALLTGTAASAFSGADATYRDHGAP